jgi:glycine hydroxymethyltransferase
MALFKAGYANVQPHSGSQANMAVYFSTLSLGDTIMGMDLVQGGHLTHGSPINFSGMYFKVISYGVNRQTELIDYKELEKLAKQYRPRMIIAGASAYPRQIDFKEFNRISKEVGAYLLVDMAHIAGIIAAGLHPNPCPEADFVTSTTHKTLRGPRGGFILCKKQYGPSIDKIIFPGIQGGPLMHVIAAKAVAFKEAEGQDFKAYQAQVIKNAKALGEALKKRGFRLVSGGTDTHLLLVDLVKKGISGKEAEEALDKAGISVNKNIIPFDTKGPAVAGGIRLGTAAVTTRGLKEEEMDKISSWIEEALSHAREESVLSRIRGEVKELCHRFPLYRVKI